jgi:hypothetical protein
MTDSDRFATVERLKQSAPADTEFLRKSADRAGFYKGASNPELLGVRDLLLDHLDRHLAALQDRLDQRLDDLDRRRPAQAPAPKSLGLDWETIKIMTIPERQKALAGASTADHIGVLAGKINELEGQLDKALNSLSKRMGKVEASLNGEGLASLLEVDGE